MPGRTSSKKSKKKVKSLEEVLKTIRENAPTLKAMKIRHLDLFGSFVRGEQKTTSDVDILVEFSEPVGFFHFYDVKAFLEEVLGRPVDLVVEDALRPEMRTGIMRELVRAS